MSQVYCKRCEAPLEWGATVSGLCPKCERGAPVVFDLPVPPSANRWWRMFPIGGKKGTTSKKGAHNVMVLSKEAKAYKAMVHNKLLVELRTQGRVLPVYPDGAVGITIHWHRTAELGDLDKRVPIVLDALQGTVYTNDRQLRLIHAELHESVNGDYIHVEAVPLLAVQETLL